MNDIEKKPFFSIIIPTYNAGKKIGTCFQSILNQHYSDFETIVMDGGSEDDTLDIARSFKDHRVKIYSEKDKGIYDAMNHGIGHAKGSWLYFIGADDSLYNKKVLEKVFQHLGPDSQSEIIYGNVLSEQHQRIYDGRFSPDKLIDENICHQAIFMHRSVFEKIGLFDISFKAYADWEHNIRWMLSGAFSIKYIPEVIANYGSGGISANYTDPAFDRRKLELYESSALGKKDSVLRKKILFQKITEAKKQKKQFSYFWGKLKYMLS